MNDHPELLEPYDAALLVSFGGPETPEEVVPFLANVTRGRGIPPERLAEVGEHYFLFGGRSPINDQCRALLAAVKEELAGRGLDIPLFWGNRNSEPFLGPQLAAIAAAGHRRVLAVVTSAYPSYSSCRQYRENLYDAAAGLPVQIDRIRHYANHPGFVAASVDAVASALDELERAPGGSGGVPPGMNTAAAGARLVFVTHSIPLAMARTAGPEPRSADGAYVDWHQVVAAEVTRQVGLRRGVVLDQDLVYCSRSGPPDQPWLEPDVNDHLRALAGQDCPGVVLVPIGFISDHMEVIFDLDTEAAATAAELELPCIRAATAGVHPSFVAGLVELMLERAAAARGEDPARPVVDHGVAGWYTCRADCCPNLREPGRGVLLSASG